MGKKDARSRLNILAEALKGAELANCSTVVFTGDFNSRLHCDLGWRQDKSKRQSFSFDHSNVSGIMNMFCNKDVCSLKDSPNAHFDELTQFLTEPIVRCNEMV